MDATCGTGRLPLVERRAHRGLVRIFDMPIGMEHYRNAYSWPYHSSTPDGRYVFLSGGEPATRVRFLARDFREAAGEHRVAGRVAEPFWHLEPGSWNSVLDFWEWRPSDDAWSRLADASRRAVSTRTRGVFEEVARALGDRFAGKRRAELLDGLAGYGPLPE